MKRTKLTFFEWLMVLFGYTYLMNESSGEVHFLPQKTANCGIDKMKRKNKIYLNANDYADVLKRGYRRTKNGGYVLVNGCVWCNRADDKG